MLPNCTTLSVIYIRGQYICISRLALFLGIQTCVFCLKVCYMFSFCMTFVLLIYFSVVIIERQSKLALYMHFMLLLACERENELQKKRVLTCYKKNKEHSNDMPHITTG